MQSSNFLHDFDTTAVFYTNFKCNYNTTALVSFPRSENAFCALFTIAFKVVKNLKVDFQKMHFAASVYCILFNLCFRLFIILYKKFHFFLKLLFGRLSESTLLIKLMNQLIKSPLIRVNLF